MLQFHPEFVVDENQKRKSVILPYQEWHHILDAMEELEDIRAYDKVKSERSEPIPFAQSVKLI